MKRSLFFLLLALCPLLMLIFGAFYDFWTVPPRAVPDDQALLENVSRINGPVRTRVTSGKEFIKELAWSEFFLGTPISAIGFLGNNDANFGPFREHWDSWGRQSEALQNYLSLLFRFKTKDIKQLRSAVDEAKRFREEFSQNPPPDSARLLQLMANIEKDLETRVELAEKLREANELIAEARTDFEQKHYEACRDACNKLLTEYKPVLERSIELDIIGLKARAEVYVDEDALSEIKLDEMDPKKRLEKLEAFLATMEGVDVEALSEEDRRQVEAFRKEAELTRMQISIQKQVDRVMKTLGELRKNPPASLPEKLAAAAALKDSILAVENKLENAPDIGSMNSRDEVKLLRSQDDNLRKLAKSWLTKALPVPKSMLGDKIQEAELKDGNILAGYFLPVKEDGKVTGYKCYPSLQEFENPTISIGTRPLADFRSPPAVPVEKKLLADYTALRKKVEEGIHVRGNWVEYHLACQKMERQLAEHRKKPGVQSGNLSFRNAENVCRLVLDTSNWDKLEKIFSGR